MKRLIIFSAALLLATPAVVAPAGKARAKPAHSKAPPCCADAGSRAPDGDILDLHAEAPSTFAARVAPAMGALADAEGLSPARDSEGGPPAAYGWRHDLSLANSPGAVPEPDTWTLMIVGFGALGLALRTRRRLQLRAAAAIAA
jgi:hypothetical protein